MQPRHLLERIGPGACSSCRAIARTCIACAIAGSAPWRHLGVPRGLVLSGGISAPSDAVSRRIRDADLFATLVPEDTYTVASAVHDLLVKTHPADVDKIEAIKGLVGEHLFIDRSRVPGRVRRTEDGEPGRLERPGQRSDDGTSSWRASSGRCR